MRRHALNKKQMGKMQVLLNGRDFKRFSEVPSIYVKRLGKESHYTFWIDCALPYYLPLRTIRKLNDLKFKYLSIHLYSKENYPRRDYSSCNWHLGYLLEEDISSFWDSVRSILMERGAFAEIIGFPDKVSGYLRILNLTKLQREDVAKMERAERMNEGLEATLEEELEAEKEAELEEAKE